MSDPAAAGERVEPTIFALSSGAPPAAIAIVRISGRRAGDALVALAGTLPRPRYAMLRALRDAEGALLDRALVLWFPGPDSATGEDLAELHLHGGRAVVAAVLRSLSVMPGLAPAEPGAFTRRAFANGRIDLGEAEGLADLLAAESEAQRCQALRLAEGGLGQLIEGWRKSLLAIAASVEAAIDHEDEADVPELDIGRDARRLLDEIGRALAAPPAERLRDGVRVILAGPTNAGKSTLLNALAGRDVAITSPLAGTTRDLVEAPVTIEGLPYVLIDSAGLRASDDPIEQAGMARARSAIASADVILWLGSPGERPPGNTILVHPKQDEAHGHNGCDVAVSALTGAGMENLRHLITRRTMALVAPQHEVALSVRHRIECQNLIANLQAALGDRDPLLIAEHLRFGLAALDKIVGRSGVEDMLDNLFAQFCIGK